MCRGVSIFLFLTCFTFCFTKLLSLVKERLCYSVSEAWLDLSGSKKLLTDPQGAGSKQWVPCLALVLGVRPGLTALLAQEQFRVSSQWIEHNIKYIYLSESTEQANSPWRRRQSSQRHRISLCPIKHPSRAGEPIRLRLKKDPGWKAWGGCSKAHPTGGAEGGGWMMTEAAMGGDWIQGRRI